MCPNLCLEIFVRFDRKIRDSILFTVLLCLKNLFFILFSKKSFSQESEDLIMKNFLPERKGNYLDIGSGFPVWGSNTYLFYRNGWRGTCIDALNRNIMISKLFRPSDLAVNALVGGKSGKYKFWEFDSYEYSTANENQANSVLKSSQYLNGEIRLVGIREITMVDINLYITSCNPLDAYLFSLDIEGFDLELLRSIDWTKFRPRVICVEDSGNLILDRVTEIHQLLLGFNYLRVGITPLSSIYVSKVYLNSLNTV